VVVCGREEEHGRKGKLEGLGLLGTRERERERKGMMILAISSRVPVKLVGHKYVWELG